MPFEFRAIGESMEDLAAQLQAAAMTITTGLEYMDGVLPPNGGEPVPDEGVTTKGTVIDYAALPPDAEIPELKKRRGRPKKEEQSPLADIARQLQEKAEHEEQLEQEFLARAALAPAEEEEDPFEGVAAEPKMTAQEAKAEAMNLLQRVWLQNKDGIRRLQTEFGVKKFIDVPAERGHELLAAVQAVAVEQAA